MEILVSCLVTLILCLFESQETQAVYYGTKIGDFANRFHQVKGEVYAVDSRTIFIKVRQEVQIQGVPIENCQKQMAVEPKRPTFDPVLVKPKWV